MPELYGVATDLIWAELKLTCATHSTPLRTENLLLQR